MDSKVKDEDFLLDGNTVVEFKLVRTAEDLLDKSFQFRPVMCHQIFGEKEMIYGYKGLTVKVYYSAAWLKIFCGFEYDEKLPDVEPADLLRKITLSYELPLIQNVEVFQKELDDERTFIPFGTLISSFNILATRGNNEDHSTYEIYLSTNETERFKEYHSRLQTFILWYIDAASFIDFDDSNWRFFIVYEKYKTKDNNVAYAFAGYFTLYEYYGYPDLVRPRISQVLILPPFQHKGICAKLLTAIYDYYSSRSNILDFTAEDPSVEFQKVRDFVDCTRVMNSSIFDSDKISEERRKEIIHEMHSTLKLNKKQARRVYEILRLKNLNPHDDEQFAKYRLEVKRRLNQPFQKQAKIRQKLNAAEMSEEALNENFIGDDERKAKLEIMFSELVEMYTSVVHRLLN